ncbi:putative SUN domain-containing ossification factor-like [Scophthalmus maximus]|uniref:Putative SUN domain-containing ossification factor-like n=1 Tax=Scophthalmus maximus TaxID=52904 RepID=A0A2U9BM23_SCOMX|nr:putative SUN domain-containing ossification factor-like [Scophthalmus maximus]
MKMTSLPPLRRLVSVWLCVAVVCRYPSCYVGCTETHQEAQGPESPQDVSAEEESGGKTPHQKVEESWISPSRYLSENELLFEDYQQNEEQTTTEQHSEAFEVKSPNVEAEVEADGESPQPSSPPMVLENSSNAHAAGTKSHTDPPLTSSVGQSAQQPEANMSHALDEQGLSSSVTTDTDSGVSGKDPEEIPTFDEWKRKMMEVENEKTQSTHTSNNGGTHTLKKAQKNFNNYASVECGAKILGSNPEAKSTSAILMENMDMYMLNPCSNKIWFIIELCEPIQLKQLDIANFELFSSTPKDFLVSVSDRYPTNKWLKLGTFHGRDERTVQSFPLDEHLYAKYVKVELVSHFGSEHFCPLSLIRVFGTSMVEEYEQIADPTERPEDQDDDLDYPSGYAPGEVKLSKNLIGSAKDVILNMVNNIAVNVLGGGPEMQVNVSSEDVNVTDPSALLEIPTQTTTTDLTSVPDSEEVDIIPDPEIPETRAPSSEIPMSETPDTDTYQRELPPVLEQNLQPLEKDQEEPISSTIVLLDTEEEEESDEEKMDHHKRRDNQYYCALLPSFSSSCSCAASLQENLIQQCSALLSKKRKCQTTDIKQKPPSITPTWQQPLSPSAGPEPQLHHSEVHEKEHASEQEPATGGSSSEETQPPGNTIESHKESTSEPPPLEPSQTSILPEPSATDSSAAKPTLIVETPQLPSEEMAKEQRPEKSPDVPAVEKHTEPSVSVGGSIHVKTSVSATVSDAAVEPTEEKPNVDVAQLESMTPVLIPDRTDQTQVLPPTTSLHSEHHPDPPAVPKSGLASTGPLQPAPDGVTELEPPAGLAVLPETKTEDLTEDVSTSLVGSGQLPLPSSPPPPPPPSASLSDIYAESPNIVEQNGNLVHGSGQKESVFMRLNNRIKALEMNMSLSGRYLEQLSQRYRKQMEEMQKAFNTTIIKLQNTSRIAEEQDLRQTESIQLLQGQLENVTQLVLNLSDRVSQLQDEVSDRQNYLLLSLLLCLCLGVLLCTNHCRIATVPPAAEPEPPIPKSYTYCCPERQFSSGDEMGLKRSASYPLIHSESFQLATTEGPEDTQSLCPANRKRRRRKIKPTDKVETLKPSFHAASELSNGVVVCNGGVPVTRHPTPFTNRFLQPLFRDSLSEGSSEGSSHSDDPSFCGITTACSRICDGFPPPKSRAEKRALRRRRPKPGCAMVDLLQVPQRDKREPLAISTIQDIMNRKTEKGSGTLNVSLTGPV